MESAGFRSADGRPITAEMRDVDRVAVEDVGLRLMQLMENAGRTLAGHVADVGEGPVVVVAGSGGNGFGGMVGARHLANSGRSVSVLLDRDRLVLFGVVHVVYDLVLGAFVGAGIVA
jgi:NAD(P)H-hydrate epimerase